MIKWNSAIVVPLMTALIGGGFALAGAFIGATWARQNTVTTIEATQARSEEASIRAACLRSIEDLEAVHSHFQTLLQDRKPTSQSELLSALTTSDTLIAQARRDDVEWSVLTRDPTRLSTAREAIYTQYRTISMKIYLAYVSESGKNPDGPDTIDVPEITDPLAESAFALSDLETVCRSEAGLPPR